MDQNIADTNADYIRNIKKILKEIEFNEPFSFFYKHKSYKYKDFYINVCKKNIYNSYLTYEFDSGILERNRNLSTEIPVYIRNQKEVLHYLFTNRYYTSLNINNIITRKPIISFLLKVLLLSLY